MKQKMMGQPAFACRSHGIPGTFVLSAMAAAAGLMAAMPVAAQTAEGAAADAVPKNAIVVVTAGKRVEKQREVAGSVSVLQGSDLERRGAPDQEAALKLVPGVQINKGDPSANAITIRGLGTSGCSICGGVTQATTGVYLDDVPQTDPYGATSVPDIAPFDLERIEVLRGPQGALYGSSSLGGAIVYHMKKPDLEEYDASVLFRVNEVNGRVGGALYTMLNVPLSSGTAGMRLVAFDREDAGYIDNPGAGRNAANRLRQHGGRLMFGMKPSAAFAVNMTAMTQTTVNDDSFGVSPDPDQLRKSTPTLSPRRSKFDFANLQLSYDLGSATLSSNTGWTRKSNFQQYDSTRIYGSVGAGFGLPVLPAITAPGDTTQTAFTEELRIGSHAGGPFSYVAGVFYSRTSLDGSSTVFTPGGAALWGPMGAVLLPNDVMLTSAQSAHASEKALFVDTEYAMNQWSVGLGGRYYRTELDYKLKATFFGSTLLDASPATADHGFTPKATLKYHFGDQLWYALAAKGYRFGGINATAPYRPYASDSLWNYETGVRLNPLPRLQLDLTAFLLDWKNAQVTAYDTSGAIPTAATVNVGKARNTGVEAALQYRVGTSWRLGAALAYTDAKTAAAYPSGAVPGKTIQSGARLPSTPRLQTAMQADYSFAGPMESRGRFNVTHTYLGDRVMDIDAFTEAAGYSTVDLGLSFAKGNWTVSTQLTNALDRRGVIGIIGGTPGIPYQDFYVQQPRALNVSLRWDR